MGNVSQAGYIHAGGPKVPSGFVLTPGGYRHKSLVHRLRKGHQLQRVDGALQQVKPATRRSPARVIANYHSVFEDEPIPALGTGWITYAFWQNNTGSPITQISAQWEVPPPPITGDAQTVFLFNALEDSNRDNLAQPVLQWGVSRVGGGEYWAIANWYIDVSGQVHSSKLKPVQSGDMLTGIISLADQSGGMFSYVSSFYGHPDLDLPINNIGELSWVSQTLEAYKIGACSDYPDTPCTTMQSVTVQTDAGNPPITWNTAAPVTTCGQNAVVTTPGNPADIDLYYRTPAGAAIAV